MVASAYHDASSGSIERGNALGDRSSVRQSRLFRQYESGNNVKSILGTDNLRWDVDQKEGVFAGHSVYDDKAQKYAAVPQNYTAAAPPHQENAPPPPRFGRRSRGQTPPPPQPQHAATAQPQRQNGRSSFDWLADALWQAVGSRDLSEVQRLLRQGADPNMICPDGWVRDECRPKEGGVGRSILHHAAWAGDLPIFCALVDAGADVERKRNTAWRPNGGVRGRGSTPMHHACMYNRTAIVSYCLEELGCDIDAPGEQGYTCLHLAAKFNYPKLVEYLLQNGARTDMLTRDEKTARDLAMAKQERSHEQMGNMVETFDRFDAEAKRRPRALPGAPLGPDPRNAGRPSPPMATQQPWQQQQQQPQPWQQHPWQQQQQQQQPMQQQQSVQMQQQQMQHMQQQQQAQQQQMQMQMQHMQPQAPPPHPALRVHEHAPVGHGGQYEPRIRQPAPAQQLPNAMEAAGAGQMRPDQAADEAAAVTRRRAMGSRPW